MIFIVQKLDDENALLKKDNDDFGEKIKRHDIVICY
jgi:hypothetical protein